MAEGRAGPDTGAGCAAMFGAVTMAMGPSLMAAAWLGEGPSFLRVVFAAAGLLLLVGGGAVAVLAAGDLLASARIGPARLEVRPESLRPGEQARTRLELCPRWGSRARSIDFTLVAERRIARQVGSRTYLEIVRLASVDAAASGPADLLPGESRTFEASLLVPPGVPGSASEGPGGKVGTFWYVEAHVRLTRWPDWVNRQALHVVTPAALEPDGLQARPPGDDQTR